MEMRQHIHMKLGEGSSIEKQIPSFQEQLTTRFKGQWYR